MTDHTKFGIGILIILFIIGIIIVVPITKNTYRDTVRPPVIDKDIELFEKDKK